MHDEATPEADAPRAQRDAGSARCRSPMRKPAALADRPDLDRADGSGVDDDTDLAAADASGRDR